MNKDSVSSPGVLMAAGKAVLLGSALSFLRGAERETLRQIVGLEVKVLDLERALHSALARLGALKDP